MDYRNFLLETLGMDEETLSFVDEVEKNFGIEPLGKTEIQDIVDDLAQYGFDDSLSASILRSQYYNIEKKAVRELNAESGLFDWRIDGKNSKIEYSWKEVRNWEELKERVKEQNRLIQKLKEEVRVCNDFKDMGNVIFEGCWKSLLRTKTYNEIIDKFDIQGVRVCSHCGSLMDQGYCIESGDAYYCDDECLESEMTMEEYDTLYDNGDTYYTEW